MVHRYLQENPLFMDLFPSLLGEKQSKQKQKGKDVFSAIPDLTAVDGRGAEGHGQNVDPNPAELIIALTLRFLLLGTGVGGSRLTQDRKLLTASYQMKLLEMVWALKWIGIFGTYQERTRGFRGSQQPVPHLTSGKRQMTCSHGMLVELHTGVILEEPNTETEATIKRLEANRAITSSTSNAPQGILQQNGRAVRHKLGMTIAVFLCGELTTGQPTHGAHGLLPSTPAWRRCPRTRGLSAQLRWHNGGGHLSYRT